MGFGGIIKKVAGIAGAASGNPLLAAAGSLIGGMGGGGNAGNIMSALQGYQGAAPNPNSFVGIRLPGITYPEGVQLVDYPDYPTLEAYPNLPRYNQAPGLPENIPTMPNPRMMGATQGESAGFRTAAEAEAAARAAVNPNDPRVQALAREEAQLMRNDYLRGLRDLTNSDRRQRAMGRQGMFSGERGAENISRVLMQGAQDANLRARLNARQMMAGYGQDLRGLSQNYQNLANLESGRRDAYRGDVKDYVGQLREDVYARTGEKRTDYANRLEQLRADMINASNQRRNDTTSKYNADVNKITAALNIANPTMQNLAAQNALYQADRNAYNTQRYNAIGGGIENILGSIFGGNRGGGIVLSGNQGKAANNFGNMVRYMA